jgi:two-component system, NarL family, invasion response regulator UvrY
MKFQNIIKVAVAEDHTLVRKAFVEMIGGFKNFEVIFDVSSGKELLQKLNKKNLPDVLMMDINMPDLDGFQTMNILSKEYPRLNVLIVSMQNDEMSIIRMVRLGVKGYLIKDTEPEEFKEALERIAEGRYHYSGYVTARMINNVSNDDDPINILTERELEFLKYLCTDMNYQQIGEKMGVSVRTVDGYRDSAYSKIRVKNRIALVMYALKKGIVNLE